MSELTSTPIVVLVSVCILLCFIYIATRCVVGCAQDFLITFCCWDHTYRKSPDRLRELQRNRSRDMKIPITEIPPLTEMAGGKNGDV
jgi:hypothetical protein